VVEHLNDDDDTEDEKANSRNGVDRKPQPKKQPQSVSQSTVDFVIRWKNSF
jgi:hypothetical protein